ncbi:PQQ-binding-like beta-propeller repeat protein [Kitasatospora sp. NPDC088134]|uniref:protein kinase domain-containing protein n=1 Tax=Kitasatospora sp. NPDC088134 TaxID=3364071 RepID=UPI003827EFD9
MSSVGQYELLRPLGEGGMGRVYLARSPGARLVALKVIRPEYAEAPDFRVRFRREVAAARRVSGFWTPAVLDADAEGVPPWLAAEYVPAPTLHEVVRDFGVLAEPGLRALGAGLAEALAAIHAAGLVHRDLKPGNVLVAADGPRVIDFGISRAVDGADSTRVTRTGAAVGTPGYLAPEQLTAGQGAGAAADVFSLACVLTFAATGAHPFGPGPTPAVLYGIVHRAPQLDGVPAALLPLLTACLHKDPGRRPTVPELLAALGRTDPGALVGPALQRRLAELAQDAARMVTAPAMPAPAPAVTPSAPANRPGRRKVLALAAGGGAVLLAAAGGAASLFGGGRGSAKPPSPGSASGIALGTAAAAPTGPAPLWQQKLSTGGPLDLFAGLLVCRSASGPQVFRADTGAPAWSGHLSPPASAPDSAPKWIGVADGLLLAGADIAGTGWLAALDSSGKQLYFRSVTPPGTGIWQLESSAAGVALLSTAVLGGFGLVAVELSSGRMLWSRPSVSADCQAVTDGTRCLVQDSGSVHGLDLRTGRQLWVAKDPQPTVRYPALTVSGGVLLISTTSVRALDAATGTALWTAVNMTTPLSNTPVVGDRVFVAHAGSNSLFGLDLHTGEQLWHVSPPAGFYAGTGQQDAQRLVAADRLIAAPMLLRGGVTVLDPADGRVRWSVSAEAGTGEWALAADDSALYVASETTLSAYRSTN